MQRLAYRPVDRVNILQNSGSTTTVVDRETLSVEVLGVPRYPTQLFESLGYFIIFIILAMFYLRTDKKDYQGFFFGMFLILVFGFRFFIEYLKEYQVEFESGMALNMGQWLSIPLVLMGLFFVMTSSKRIRKYE